MYIKDTNNYEPCGEDLNHSNSTDLWRRFGSVVSLRTKLKQHSQPPLPPLPTNATHLDRVTSPSSIEDEVVSSPTTRPSRKHLDIVDWLRALSLEQYEKLFEDYHGVEEIIDFSEADIKSLGVKISSHRAFIMSSLTALRNKYHGNTRKIMRHSVAVDNRNKIIEKERISHLKTVAETVQSKSLDNLKMHSQSGGCLDPNSTATTPTTQQSPLTPNHPTTPTPPCDPPASAASLKKVLEFELSLDSRDLRSHAWYHGNIPRSRADDLVREDGHFLVRDCTSQPGNYVLSGRRNQQPLHFVINRLLLQPDTVYERVQYHFEDEHYDTVPDLITAYVGSGRAITALSGARIQVPVNRSYPLSYYASRYQGYSSSSRMSSSPSPTTPSSGGFKSPLQLYKTPSPTRCSMRDNPGPPPPRLPSKKQRSHSLTPAEVNRMSQEKCNSADGVIQSQTMTRSSDSAVSSNNNKFSSQSLPRKPVGKLSISPSSITLGRGANTVTSNNSMGRVFSNHSLCGEDDFHQQHQQHHHHHHHHQQRLHHHSADSPPPPPKPCRVSSLPPTRSESCKEDMFSVSEGGGASSGGSLNRVSSYHAASGGSDSGNGSGDSALSSATSGEQCCPSSAMEMMHIARCSSGVVIKNPRYNMTSSDSTSALRCTNYDFAAAESRLMSTPHDDELAEPLETTRFDLDNFHTILLPTGENKPLDAQTLHGVKLMLKESGSRILANHLTRCDLDLIFGELGDVNSSSGGDEDVKQRKFGSGLELCTLPHGHQFRMDIIERTECMKLLVAVTILTCSNDEERVEILNRWIEVAIDTKTALGNLYGFCSIMLGLCLPQIQKLDTTWHHLRQTHTDHAFMFEAKLRPTLKAMNDCTNPQAPNTTVPHLLPYVLLMESGAGSAADTSGTSTSLSGTTMVVASTPPPQNNYSNSSVIAAQLQNNYSNEAAQCMEQLTVSSSQDLGLGMTLAHLDSARKFVEGARGYRRNADIVLGGDSGLGMMTAAARVEDLIGDLVRTEFQQKFLWGSRGALAASRDRHSKFALVLQALAEKYCAGTSTSSVPAVSLASPLIEGVAV